MNSIDVCLSPKLLSSYSIESKIIVVVDVLRATTIITSMFHNGLSKLIPVKTLEHAKEMKAQGYLVAAERNGKKVDFADFNNSPFTFTSELIQDKTLVYSTTNGTNTINLVKDAESVYLACFLNLSAIVNQIKKDQKDVLILCSGWQGDFCTEDALFAGALTEELIKTEFEINSDSSTLSLKLWEDAKNNLLNYVKTIHQYKRLVDLGLKKVIDYCFKIDITDTIPVLKNNYIVDLKKLTEA